MTEELGAKEFQSSLSAWIQILKTAAPTGEPEPQLVDDWIPFASKTEATSIAASGISPSLLAEAVQLGFQPDDREPDALAVLQARVAGHLTDPIERSTARQLSIALIDFTREDHCALTQPAMRISEQTHLSLADAVFLLKKSHEVQQIVTVLHERTNATAAEVHELIRFGSTAQDWSSLSVEPSTRRLLQRGGITPDQYRGWAKLGVAERNEILDAAQLWKPDQAEDWMTALSVSHREAADWFKRGHDLRLTRAWLSLGYDAAQAGELEARDVGPAEAKKWASLGVCDVDTVTAHRAVWTPDELAKWDGWDAPEALAWSTIFKQPEHAKPWQQAGFSPDFATKLAARGWPPERAQCHSPEVLQAALSFTSLGDPLEEALRRIELWQSLSTRDAWLTALGFDTEHDQLDDWFRSGLSLESAAFLREKGRTPADAALLKELGVTSVQEQEVVLRNFETPREFAAWLNAGFTQETATRWNAAGYSVETATEWRGVNATLAQANELSTRGATPETWRGYSDLGIELGTAAAMAQNGLTPEKFLVWQNQLRGLGALDVLAWFGTGGSLQEVTGWQAQGFTPVQAAASHKSLES